MKLIRRLYLSKKNIILTVLGFFLFAAFLLITFTLIQGYTPLARQKTISFSNPENQRTFDKWLNQIKKIGGKNAYALFKIETEKKPVKQQHNDAHLFGEALYLTEGLNGVTVCDASFSFGCYHSFLGSAIYSEGLEVVPTLSDKCFVNLGKNGLACQHGIGHGVLSAIGYDLESVNKSLSICDKLKDKDSIGGCPGGVFMEYNFQTMLLDEGKVRKFDKSEPYFPCFSIDSLYSGACLYQQAQWWLSALDNPEPENIHLIDELCNNLQDSSLQTQCYKGFGLMVIAYIDFDLQKAKSICASLSSRNAEIICRSGVAISLLAIPSLREDGRKLCEDPDFNKKEQDLCLRHTDQIATSPTKNNL